MRYMAFLIVVIQSFILALMFAIFLQVEKQNEYLLEDEEFNYTDGEGKVSV